jgi:hypothetical protein
MSIDRDHDAERQVRVDRMLTEFREAQERRRVKAKGAVAVASPDEDETGPPPTGQPPVSTAHAARRLP